jgi:hypothetical protein
MSIYHYCYQIMTHVLPAQVVGVKLKKSINKTNTGNNERKLQSKDKGLQSRQVVCFHHVYKYQDMFHEYSLNYMIINQEEIIFFL